MIAIDGSIECAAAPRATDGVVERGGKSVLVLDADGRLSSKAET
jgi:hypothetical protein